MIPAAVPVNDSDRVNALRKLNLIGAAADPRFDKIVHFLIDCFDVSIAEITLVDWQNIFHIASAGVIQRDEDRQISFSSHVILQDEPFVVCDTLKDERFLDNPQVVGFPNVRFYAGVPITSSDGFKIGALGIKDKEPREFSEKDKKLLLSLVRWVKDEIEMFAKANDDSSRKLSEAEAKSKTLLNNIGEGVIGFDDGGELTYINRQALESLGYAEDEILRKPVFHVIKLQDEKGNEPPIEQRPSHASLSTGRRIVSRNFYYVRKDGSRFPAAITASPVILGQRVIGGVVVFRDISYEHEVDRMKTEFISLASHQLRTPLSAMKWFSEMLLAGDIGEITKEQREIVKDIYDSNERMIDLVNSLLNISRIESGRIIIDPKKTNLKELIDSVIIELQPKIIEKKHHLGLSVHSNLPLINIDPKLIRHVYMNLLTNAIKYTPNGGDIEIVVSKSGEDVVSRVSDNGYGIPETQKPKVFQKFFRADNVIKVETDGTGLGLYLVKAVVESSGGKIWFESSEGKGTTFWFSLPLTGSQPKKGEVTIS